MRSLALVAVACAVLLLACSDTADGPGAGIAAAPTTGAPLPPVTTKAPPVSGAITTSTTTSTTSTSTTTTLPPPKAPIVLGFAGDTSFTHGLSGRDPLGDITVELSAPDLMLVNLETTVAESGVGRRVDKTYTFKSPPESVAILTDAGIDGVQLANNHTLDFRTAALLRTLELLDEGRVPHAGAGPDPAAAYAPAFFDVGDWRVGLVAFSRVPCDWSRSGENTRPEVAWTCDPFVIDTLTAVSAAAAESDITVVMVHWGIERDHCPQPYQRDLARAWARLGADLIIGGHPHVLQGVEQIEGAWLVNSTGNFAFPSARQASARSALFEFTVREDGSDLRVVPVRITSGRPAPAVGDDAAAILRDLTKWSFGFEFGEDGRALPTDEAGVCS